MVIPLGPYIRRWAPSDWDHDPRQGQFPQRSYRPKASVVLTNPAAQLVNTDCTQMSIQSFQSGKGAVFNYFIFCKNMPNINWLVIMPLDNSRNHHMASPHPALIVFSVLLPLYELMIGAP